MLLKIIFVLCLAAAFIDKTIRQGGGTVTSFLVGIVSIIAMTFFVFYPRRDGIFWVVFVIFGALAYALYGIGTTGIMLLVLVVRWLYGKWYDRD